MLMYPQSLNNLIECLKKLPGIGDKSAERHALAIMSLSDEDVTLFSNSLKDVKTKIKRCKKCNNYSEEDLCIICKNANRKKNIICIVEEPKNIILFEKIGSYDGTYHVLNGLISPLDGVNPEDLNINQLIERIKEDQVSEIIIAIKSTIEGETTSLYISKLLENMPVKITKIAYGIPLGTDIDYIDLLTLEMALNKRQEIS
ncbi:MAG: recombination mediator RecR [Bacilli bacterium]|nr:recombination mediator RecR [Bacilli bacterium]